MGLGSAISNIAGSAIGAVGSLVGGNVAANNAQAMAGLNYKAQKEFAQNGIRWKVEDAKRAGIHPLYALGANTSSFSPVSGYGGDYGISDAAAQFGQGFERAQQAKMTKKERERAEVRDALQDMLAYEQLRQQKRFSDAQIRLIDSEIFRNYALSSGAVRRAALPPEMPGTSGNVIPGQAQSYSTGQTQPEISSVVTSEPGLPNVQAGVPPDVRFYSTSRGRTPLPTEAAGDAMDAAFGAGLQWAMRNSVVPFLANFFPMIKDSNRKDGEYYDIFTGEYVKKDPSSFLDKLKKANSAWRGRYSVFFK